MSWLGIGVVIGAVVAAAVIFYEAMRYYLEHWDKRDG